LVLLHPNVLSVIQDISIWLGFPYDIGAALPPLLFPEVLFIFHPQQPHFGLFSAGGNWH
jgi:hypothetical protein